jgi:hypothetical protein
MLNFVPNEGGENLTSSLTHLPNDVRDVQKLFFSSNGQCCGSASRGGLALVEIYTDPDQQVLNDADPTGSTKLGTV